MTLLSQMMKCLNYILILFSISFCSCSRNVDMGPQIAGEGVRIEFRLPGVYDNISASFNTKAEASEPLRHINDQDPYAPEYAELISLPIGSTLWLTYSKKDEETGLYSDPELKAYKIIDSGGYHSMFACDFYEQTGEDGNTYMTVRDDTPGQPLILTDGTYRFKMISPALPVSLDEEKGWRIPVDNGLSFYATDNRYYETVSKDIIVDSRALDNSGHNVQYIRLNPIINQTARWNFKIFKGENVKSLDMMPQGIEISGLQNPYDTVDGERVKYYWASEDIKDTLRMKMGDKRQWVRIYAQDMWTSSEVGPGGSKQEALCGDIGFLPTNSLSTTVVILFNMLVNGIPTQYETTVNQMIFEHAHSYNIGVSVDQKDGIRVFNWQNQSWSADLELYPDNQ